MNNELNPYPELNSLEKFRAALETTNFLYYQNKDLAKCDEDRVHLLRMQHTAIKNGWCDVMDAYESNVEANISMNTQDTLNYIRGEIEAERVSYGEIAQLQALAEHIDSADTLLLEWAGIEEQ